MCVCVKATSGMQEKCVFCVVNPCNLVCGTHCGGVPVYPDLVQPFYAAQQGQKAESYTLLCQYGEMHSVTVILHKSLH